MYLHITVWGLVSMGWQQAYPDPTVKQFNAQCVLKCKLYIHIILDIYTRKYLGL